MWEVVVLIYKRGENLYVIAIFEVVCMVLIVITNCPFTASISFHDILHGFREVFGTGNGCGEGGNW